MAGEIGGNDYNYALFQGKIIDHVKGIVPNVVEAIMDAVRVSFRRNHSPLFGYYFKKQFCKHFQKPNYENKEMHRVHIVLIFLAENILLVFFKNRLFLETIILHQR